MPRDSLYERLLLAGGVLGVALGTYFPWLRVNPTLPADAKIPTMYITGMESGIAGLDFPLLGLVALAAVGQLGDSHSRLPSLFTLLTGVATVFACGYYLASFPVVGFDGTFVPDRGWYLTVLAGGLLVITGGMQLSLSLRKPVQAAP